MFEEADLGVWVYLTETVLHIGVATERTSRIVRIMVDELSLDALTDEEIMSLVMGALIEANANPLNPGVYRGVP